MEQLLQQIENYKTEITAYTASDADAVEAFRIKYLGTKGLVKNVMGEMKNVPNDRKKEFGQILNEFKQFAETKFEELKESISSNGSAKAEDQIDLSLPGDPLPLGSRHPISLVR